jgi:hypothetical protein
MLARSIAGQFLQSVPRYRRKIVQAGRRMQDL